jgi:ABC-type Fe3+-hydroxamate transport system substrate-binding protein
MPPTNTISHPMKRPTTSAVVLAAVLTLAGCASQATKSDSVASKDEYEYVTPLGSNIPVKVKKGEKVVTMSPTDKVNADQATKAVRSGGGQMPATPGQTP